MRHTSICGIKTTQQNPDPLKALFYLRFQPSLKVGIFFAQ